MKVPADAQRIDVTGKYIIPGLWDMHAHYEQVEWGPIYLAAGVTTVRDVGNEFEFITAVRDAVNSGKALGPHMLLAGIVDGDSPYAIGVARVNSPADAQTWVQRYHDAGFQQMKIYSSVKSENVKAICTDAHKLGMTVTGHIPEGMTAYDGVNDGMDQINHIHYILDLLKPKDFDRKGAKAAPRRRAKMMASLDVNSDAGKQAVAFLREHNTVIDPDHGVDGIHASVPRMCLRIKSSPESITWRRNCASNWSMEDCRRSALRLARRSCRKNWRSSAHCIGPECASWPEPIRPCRAIRSIARSSCTIRPASRRWRRCRPRPSCPRG